MRLTERQKLFLFHLLSDTLHKNVVGYLSTTHEVREIILNEILNQQDDDSIIESKYHGITYDENDKLDCDNGYHHLDETWNGEDHYLYCDECGLMVWIERIDKSYMDEEGIEYKTEDDYKSAFPDGTWYGLGIYDDEGLWDSEANGGNPDPTQPFN